MTALLVLVMTLAKLPVSVMSDASTSLADSNIPDNEITASQYDMFKRESVLCIRS